jgi:putative Mg2+ transporter-C (MgtC) family protein
MEQISGGLFAHWNQDVGIVLRLLVAAVLSGVLGWERESERKSAGLRTHILVGIGSALFMSIVVMEIETFPHETNVLQFDPIRVIQGVVAGIAFLGAGIIFVDKSQHRVRGLTTAASIWTTTGIGLTVGLGRYLLATMATILIWLVLRALLFIAPQRNDVDEDADQESYEEREVSSRKEPNAGAM